MTDEEVALAVLNETIAVRRKRLKDLNSKIEAAERQITARLATDADEEREHKKELSNLNTQAGILHGSIVTLRKKAIDKKDEIKKLDLELVERHHYEREVEVTIAKTIEDGNLTLRSLQLEIGDLEESRAALRIEVSAIEAKKTEAAYELTQLDQNMATTLGQTTKELTTLQTAIKAAKKDLADVRKERKQIITKAEERLAEADLKEKGIAIKREAMRLEGVKIAEDKRRWYNTKILYDI